MVDICILCLSVLDDDHHDVYDSISILMIWAVYHYIRTLDRYLDVWLESAITCFLRTVLGVA